MLARNKRSVVLDLKGTAAQDIVRQLADESDVLIENVRPGALEGFGLAPELLIVRNPKLIVRRVSGDGQTGPYRGKPGFGVVAEAMDGLRHLSGEPGQVPVRVGVSIGDTLAALPGARHAANSDAGRWQRAGRARHCAQTVVHAGAAPPPCARAGAGHRGGGGRCLGSSRCGLHGGSLRRGRRGRCCSGLRKRQRSHGGQQGSDDQMLVQGGFQWRQRDEIRGGSDSLEQARVSLGLRLQRRVHPCH